MSTRNPANHYEFTGDALSGTVDLAGITGQPVVNLQFDQWSITEANVDTGELGIVVSARLDFVPDKESSRLHLVLPATNIADEAVPVEGFAVLVTTRSSIAGPGLVEGPLQSYAVRSVSGTASLVAS
ncbi:MAG: hypothetical protein M3513_18015 [Actinomycetota bacterium]|nr:hypothetical protein [Actinomycetota bacterium]